LTHTFQTMKDEAERTIQFHASKVGPPGLILKTLYSLGGVVFLYGIRTFFRTDIFWKKLELSCKVWTREDGPRRIRSTF